MKILITGASGMVGRHIIEHSKASKHEIICRTHKQCDLTNTIDIINTMLAAKPEIVIHCAGYVGGIQKNVNEQSAFLFRNATMGLNLLRICEKSSIKKVINIGSSCMYPAELDFPIPEDWLLNAKPEPTNEGYAIAKIAVAKYGEHLSNETDTKCKTIIPCNLFGPYDKFDVASSHMIPAAIRKIYEATKQNLPTVEIWGDGTARREFMYAGNLADFIWLAVDKFDQLPKYTNVGINEDYSITEYYQKIAEIIGYKGRFLYDSDKPVGMKRKLINSNKAFDLGWRPRVDLETGIHETLAYYLKTLK